MEKKEYTLFSLIEIRFADPISAIALSNNFLIIGSTMGRITLQSLEDGKTVLISELSTENISGISFSNDEYSFFVAIGDEQVLKFPSDTSIIGPIKRVLNYKPNNVLSPLSTPLKPMKAIARRPAVMRAMLMPCSPLGTSIMASCSRMPAKTTSAKAKPIAVLMAKTTPVKRLGSRP